MGQSLMSTTSTEIGEGTYGKVYNVNSKAVKDFRFYWAFYKEVLVNSILSNIPNDPDYPNNHIVRFESANFDKYTAIMDLYDYNLVTYIKDSKYYEQRHTVGGIEERKHIIDDIFDGLYTIHSTGLIHNDLSISNVLLKRVNGKLTTALCDFGAAIISGISNHSITSPSIESPDKIITSAHDYYAVGAIICGMYNPHIIAKRKCGIDHIKLVPDQFQSLVIGLLDNDPNKRILAVSEWKMKSKNKTDRTAIDKLDIKHQDSKHQDSKHQDSKQQDSKQQDSKHQDSKHQDSKHQDSKHLDYIMKCITKFSDIQFEDTSKKAFLRAQQHLNDDSITYFIAFTYLATMLVDIVFDYEAMIADLDYLMYNYDRNRNIIDDNDTIKKNIELIIKDPSIIRLFIEYHR